MLLRADPSPVVELNRAAAVAMRDGPAAGLALIDAILARGDLTDYHLAHSARADLCRRLGRIRGGARLLRTRPRPHAAGAGATLSRQAVGGSLAPFGSSRFRPAPRCQVGLHKDDERLQAARVADLAARDPGSQEADVVAVLAAERAMQMTPLSRIMQRAGGGRGSRHIVLLSPTD